MELEANEKHPKNHKKKFRRKEFNSKDVSSDGSLVSKLSLTAVNSFHDPNKNKKRVRRHSKKNKELSIEAVNVEVPVQSSLSKDIVNNINDPNNDILDLQALFFRMNNLKGKSSSPSPKKFESNPKRKNRHSEPKDGENIAYDIFLTEDEVLKGLENKTLLEGSLRINPKCSQQAYVSHPDKTKKDIFISGLRDRNRALDEDKVVVETKPLEKGSDKLSGKVVFIKKRIHSQTCVGNIKINSGSKTEALFYPRDKRMPLLSIPIIDCPPCFTKEHKQYENTLFLAKIVNWFTVKYTVGTLLANIGQAHDLKCQTKAILMENDLDVVPYGKEFDHFYPNADFTIPNEELKYREDFRNCCVFTIDPLTARDLDDAMSCRILDNGNYEVGVHISDVAFYLQENNELDDMVANKATTVYLVDGTYHMLPKPLCFLCSLLPGSDKLTFSVIWEITPEGKIINHRFTRSVINSCTQLAYDHAQILLENPGKILDEKDLPVILGNWNLENVRDIVNVLYKLSVIFRSKRFESGALRIDQPKLTFKLDAKNGYPVAYRIEEHNESHSLIEEFMLLANCTVAARIYQDHPGLAFLRLHPAPKNTIEAVADNFCKIGINLDISSAGRLQSSLATFAGNDLEGEAKAMVLHTHLIKTLSRALYFCSEGHEKDDIRHYSLNIPIYTHFTSPIRRYADIIVHRLLSASLGYTPRPQWTSEYVQGIADNCNKQKYSAKRAGDMSSDLYLMKYISLRSPLLETAAVLDVFDSSLDVIVLSMGLVKKVYFDNFSNDKVKVTFIKSTEDGIPNEAAVLWESSTEPQVLKIFSIVQVSLEKTKDLMVINTRIVKPNGSAISSQQ